MLVNHSGTFPLACCHTLQNTALPTYCHSHLTAVWLRWVASHPALDLELAIFSVNRQHLPMKWPGPMKRHPHADHF